MSKFSQIDDMRVRQLNIEAILALMQQQFENVKKHQKYPQIEQKPSLTSK